MGQEVTLDENLPFDDHTESLTKISHKGLEFMERSELFCSTTLGENWLSLAKIKSIVMSSF